MVHFHGLRSFHLNYNNFPKYSYQGFLWDKICGWYWALGNHFQLWLVSEVDPFLQVYTLDWTTSFELVLKCHVWLNQNPFWSSDKLHILLPKCLYKLSIFWRRKLNRSGTICSLQSQENDYSGLHALLCGD